VDDHEEHILENRRLDNLRGFERFREAFGTQDTNQLDAGASVAPTAETFAGIPLLPQVQHIRRINPIQPRGTDRDRVNRDANNGIDDDGGGRGTAGARAAALTLDGEEQEAVLRSLRMSMPAMQVLHSINDPDRTVLVELAR
jgi:hypothetical protein